MTDFLKKFFWLPRLFPATSERNNAESAKLVTTLDYIYKRAGSGSLWQIAGQLSGARFSRDDENEADRYGVKYTVAADYDPRGLIDFFAKLKQMKNSRSSDLGKLFASHPPTGERIKHIEKLMLKYGVEGGERHRKRFLQATAGLRRAHSSAHSGYGRK